MHFQIEPLPMEPFAHLFGLDDAELARHLARRETVTESPGTPCRVSLQDAACGETVILVNYVHQPANSPYRSSHAVFVRQNAKPARLSTDEVPDVIKSRLISVRCFDRHHMITDAQVVAGEAIGRTLSRAFDDDQVEYAHLHYANPGCFAATARRAL